MRKRLLPHNCHTVHGALLVDWWQKDDLQRQMRSKIKRQLRASGVEADAVESLAANIVDLAKVRTDR